MKIVFSCIFLMLLMSCGQSDNDHAKGNNPDVAKDEAPDVVIHPDEKPALPPDKKPEEVSPGHVTTKPPVKQPDHSPKLQLVDDVFGKQIPHDQSWRAERGRVFNRGKEVVFYGVNWFGFETKDLMVHGVWTGRTVVDFLTQVKGLGFNALRLPLSPEALSNLPSSWGRPTAKENLIEVLQTAQDLGLYVLLDLHNCNYKSGYQVGDPAGCNGYTITDWYRTLRDLAGLSIQFPNVWGIDIFNEPHKLSWRDWRVLSDEAVKQILGVNPRVLVIIEGVNSTNTDNKGYWTFWGENLVEAADNPVNGPASRIVYTPHAYGPSVAWQTYFGDPAFPSNMEKIWDLHFGYMVDRGYTLMIGEWGGRYVDKDKVWQDAFVAYLKKRGIKNWFYWSWNANSGDTGGILLDDWKTVNSSKMDLLRQLM